MNFRVAFDFGGSVDSVKDNIKIIVAGWSAPYGVSKHIIISDLPPKSIDFSLKKVQRHLMVKSDTPKLHTYNFPILYKHC